MPRDEFAEPLAFDWEERNSYCMPSGIWVYDPGMETLGDPVGRYLQRISEAARKESDELEWYNPTSKYYDLTSGERTKIQQYSIKLYFTNPTARNIINVLTFYTIGEKGVRVDFRGNEVAEKAFNRFATRNNWNRLTKEIVRRTFIFGEDFLLFFPMDEKMKEDVRHEDPDQMKVVLNKEDRGTVEGYKWKSGRKWKFIPPETVVHSKINDVGLLPRGRPVLEPAFKMLSEYDRWLNAATRIDKVRSRVPLIRYRKGPSQYPVRQLPEETVVITAPLDGERWEFPDLSRGGANTDVGREIKLAIAVAVGLPEVLIDADATRANYAANLVTEGTPLAMFHDLQGIFVHYFEQIVRLIVGKEVEFDVVMPEVDLRTKTQQVNATISAYREGLMSKRTAQQDIGLDPNQEERNMQEELERELGGMAGRKQPAGMPLGLAGLGGGGVAPPAPPPAAAGGAAPTGSARGEIPAGGTPAGEAPAAGETAGGEEAAGGATEESIRRQESLTERKYTSAELPIFQEISQLVMSGQPIVPKDALPEEYDKLIAGMDFGFEDPAALIVVGIKDDRAWAIYEDVQHSIPVAPIEEGGDSWVKRIREVVDLGVSRIYCDPNDPESIYQLEQRGLPAVPADREIKAGLTDILTMLKEGRLLISEELKFLIGSLTGSQAEHGVDALRYAIRTAGLAAKTGERIPRTVKKSKAKAGNK